MTLPLKRQDIEEKRIGDELYLYLPDGQTLTVLNTTAMMIWSLCDGQHKPEDMVTILLDITADPGEDVLRRDIQACLDDFSHRNMLISQNM